MYNAVLCLSLCHNVTPMKSEGGSWELQGSSPDELALVRLGGEVGLRITYRDDYKAVIEGDLRHADVQQPEAEVNMNL